MELAGRAPNPFDDYIVSDPWQRDVADVPEIHAAAYALCCQARDYVQQQDKSTSVLLHGTIGSGKTHLIARLRKQWAFTPSDSFGLPGPGLLFMAHRFAPSPSMIWRQLRRSLARDMLRPNAHGSSQLFRLLLYRLAEARPAEGELLDWWDYMGQRHADPGELDRELGDLFDKLDQLFDLGRDLSVVLKHLVQDRYGRDVRDWFRGIALPDETLTALGLPNSDGEEDPETQARDFIITFCRLAGRDHPLVICFDQIEALQVHPRDQAGLFAFGQLISDLHDQTTNVLMISCVQSNFLVPLREYVAGQNYHRLARMEGSLDLLNCDQAIRLIVHRLTGQPELAALRAGHPDQALWPLPEEALGLWLGGQPKAAREILTHCSRLMGAQPPPSMVDFLAKSWSDRFARSSARMDVSETDLILAEGLPLLFHLTNKDWRIVPADGERDLELILEGPSGRLGISLCNHPSMTRLAARLRRLKDSHRGPKLRKLVLLRDARLPITRSARKTKSHMKDLEHEGTGYVQPSVEVLAALDTLRSMLAEAKSGDLVNAGEAVEAAIVEQWLVDNLPPNLRAFVEEILTARVTNGPLNVNEIKKTVEPRI